MGILAVRNEIVTPPNPASGYTYLYAKTDGKVYKKTEAGVESEVGSGGGTTNYLTDYGIITDTITTTTDYGSLT